MAQLVRGPGSVSGRELVVGADWLSVGDPASEGETVEFWAHPRDRARARDRRITLGWGGSSLRFRTALEREKWSHVAVSWDDAGIRFDLDGQTVESYGLGEPSGVAEPHRLSVGRRALTSAPRWVALYNKSIDLRSVVRHYRAALPLLEPAAPPATKGDGRVVAHAAAVPANTVLPAITGTAKDGQTLTSTTGTWSGSPTSYARQWLRCDTAGTNCTNISGATATTYVVTSTDVGATIRVKITATNASGSGTANSAQTATVAAAAPVVSAVPTISGTAQDGQTLTSTTGTWSGTPTITYARQWNRCNSGGTGCVAISGATGTTYVVTTADIGSKLSVTVTASNAAGSASSSSVVTALVVGAAPVNTALPVISGTAKEGQLLSSTTGTWSGSPTITYAYQWQSCTPTCTNISGATASTYRLVAAQVGKTIKVVVTATNSISSVSATSAATATVTTGAPVNTALPVVTGTTTDGQTLSSTTGTWAGTATITFARQWKRCDAAGANCTNISGATGATYTLVSADVGSTIKLTVTATNGVGSAAADAATTAVIAAVAPANTAVPTITGSAQDGQALTSTTGTWSGTTPITYTRQWNRCNSGGTGCVNISGATGTTYTVTAADIGSKLKVTVTASNTAGSASSSSVVTALVVGAVPANTALPVISGTAKEGQLLSATTGTWSGTAPITYTYQWQSCSPTCTNISAATASTYRLVAAEVSKTIKVVVTATNGTGSASATSAATATVTTGAPVNTALPVVTGTTTYGQTLSSTTGTWAGTATITYGRQWKRCNSAGGSCTNISGATGTTYTLVAADVGSTIKLTVTATNGVGNTAADAATTAVIAGIAPANTAVPTVSGTATDGQTLTSTTGTWSGTPTPTFTRQWRRCDTAGANCVDISGATNATYVLTSADVGAKIRVTVTASNSAGSASAPSAATTTIAGVAPSNTSVPTVSGVSQVGIALTTTTGSWAGSTPQTFAYQWLRCATSCTAIAGATGSSFTPTVAELGATIKARVTATNGAGSASADSLATAAVVPAPPSNTAAPTITGTLRVGHELTALTGSWDGSNLSYSYQWRRCDASGASCADISGETDDHLSLHLADVGQTIKVTVQATNASGSASAQSAASTVVASAASGAPAVVLAGDVPSNASQWVSPDSYSLDITATAANDASGLDFVQVTIDNNVIQRWDGACSGSGCVSHHSIDIDATAIAEGEHSVAVTAVDLDGHPTTVSTSIKLDAGAPLAPGNLTIANETAPVLEWTPSSATDVDHYVVLRRTNPTSSFTQIATVDGTTYTDELAPIGTPVQYEIKAADQAGNLSSPSTVVENDASQPSAAAPQNAEIEAWDDQITLDWDTSSSAVAYEVYRRASTDADFERITDDAVTATAFTDYDVDSDTSYVYEVRSVSSTGRLSLATSELTTTIRNGPADEAPTVTLSGELIDAADDYQSGTRGLTVEAAPPTPDAPGITDVEVTIDEVQVAHWTQTCPTGGCTLEHSVDIDTTTLDDGGHDLTVTATDADDRTAVESSDLLVNNVPPAALQGFAVSRNATTHKIDLFWLAGTDPDLAGYVITDYTGATHTVSGDRTSYTSEQSDYDLPVYDSATCPSTCWIVIEPIDGAGQRGDGASLQISGDPTVSAPALTATGTQGSVDLSWSSSGSGVEYRVYRADADGSNQALLTSGGLTGLAYSDTSAEPGVTYRYTVRAVATDQTVSPSSNEATAARLHSSTVPTLHLDGTLFDQQGLTITAGTYDLTAYATEPGGVGVTSVNVTLDGTSQAAKEESCSAGGCSLSVDLSLTASDLTDGTHTIEATAVDASGETTTTSFQFRVDARVPGTVNHLRGVSAAGDVKLSWDVDDNADASAFDVLRGTSPSNLAVIGHISDPSQGAFTDTNVNSGTTYAYAVRLTDRAGNNGPNGTVIYVLTGGAGDLVPTGLTATAGPYRISLSWNTLTAPDLTGFTILRKLDGESQYTRIAKVAANTTSYVDSSLGRDVHAQYELTTLDTNGETGPPTSPVAASTEGLNGPEPTRPVVTTFGESRLAEHPSWLGDQDIGTYQTPVIVDGSMQSSARWTTACVEPAGWSDPADPNRFPACAFQGSYGYAAMMTWSADKTMIGGVLTGQEGSVSNNNNVPGTAIDVTNIDTGELRILCTQREPFRGYPSCGEGDLAGGGTAGPVQFSPDGAYLYYEALPDWLGAAQEVRRINIADRTVETVVTSDLTHNWIGHFALADGHILLLRADAMNPTRFWEPASCSAFTVDADGSNLTAVQTNLTPAQLCTATPLPAGDGFLYIDQSSGYQRVGYLAPGATEGRVISPPGIGATNRALSISPDAERVNFVGHTVAINAQGYAITPEPDWTAGSFGQSQHYSLGLENGDTRERSETPWETHQWIPWGVTHPQANSALKLSGQAQQEVDTNGDPALVADATVNAIGTDIDGVSLLYGTRSTTVHPNGSGDIHVSVGVDNVAEGTGVARLVATSTSGLERSIPIPVAVDHSPPNAVTGVRRTASSTSGQDQVDWDEPVDPELADGSPGSGVKDVQFRYGTTAGDWSTWTTPVDNQATMPHDTSTGTVEFRLEDGAGNLRVSRGHVIPPHDEVDTCNYDLAVAPRAANDPLNKTHVANASIAALYQATKCNPNILEVTAKLCVQTYSTADPTDPNSPTVGAPINAGCTKFKTLPYQQKVMTVDMLCQPGIRPYSAELKDVKYKLDDGTIVGGLVGGGTEVRRIDCNEAGAWTYLAYSKTANPSTRLGNALGRGSLPPVLSGQNRGFEAHHILPVKDSALLRQYAYACYYGPDAPNQKRNGIWLRGPRLRAGGEAGATTDTAGFRALKAYDNNIHHKSDWHLRQYHRTLTSSAYYAEVIRRMSAATGPNVNWACIPSKADDAMDSIYQDLRKGTMPY